MTCEECVELGMPLSLCSDGKPYPLDIIPGELIYRRHNQPGSEGALRALSESEIGNKIFKLDNDSYNRSFLCDPEHTLLNEGPSEARPADYYENWGIISLNVDGVLALQGDLNIQGVVKHCTLAVIHTATPCNYSHAEIYLYMDGVLYDGKAPKSARPYFRKQLQELLSVVKEAV